MVKSKRPHKKKPHVILSTAISLDGKIATKTGDSKLSSKSDKIRIHKLRSKVDAILIGKNTLEIDDPLLTSRLVKGKNPTRIILDSKGTISSKSQILKTSHKVSTIIVTTKKITKRNVTRLQKFPIELITMGVQTINIKNLLDYLYTQKKIRSILVEGGGKVNWSFIKENLVDELIVTVTPYVIGGQDAVPLIDGPGFPTISKSKKLKLNRIYRLKNEVVLAFSTSRFLY
jgi:2,5-diamino-6-(ribosylamino)-4(3H)-pyrimidinone 5'-phosphate reductase